MIDIITFTDSPFLALLHCTELHVYSLPHVHTMPYLMHMLPDIIACSVLVSQLLMCSFFSAHYSEINRGVLETIEQDALTGLSDLKYL